MDKLKVAVPFPYKTVSGYGKRSYDLLRALIELKWDDWEFHIASLKFGRSPFIELDATDPINQKILSREVSQQELFSKQYDIALFCTVPSEMINMRIAKYQILFTASIESDIAPPEFLQGGNCMDLIITSSKQGAEVLKLASYEQKDQYGNSQGILKLNTPVLTLIEGVDTEVFNPKNNKTFDLSQVKEDFCFLSNGMLLPGAFTNPYGHDRKHLLTLIKTFQTTFKDSKTKPALILKTNSGEYSHSDHELTLKRISEVVESTGDKNLPPIYILHGNITTDELIGLYQHPKVKAYVCIGNEGWGRGAVEASAASSKPLILSYYGGHLEYGNFDYSVPVGGSMQPTHPSVQDKFLVTGSNLFYPDIRDLSKALKEVYTNYKKYEEQGKRQGHYIRTKFDIETMKEELSKILTDNIPELPRTVTLTLPKLNRK